MKKFFFKNWSLLLLVGLALLVRSYRITNPILDWHSFRQADTASVTREYVKHGVNILVPRYHDHSNIQSGKDNLEGYRMVEFPFINGAIAETIRFIPSLPLEITSRFVSVLFSLGMLICLFFLTKEISGNKVAYIALIVGALLPYNIYYSRVIMPEPAMLFFSVLSLLGFYYWLKKGKLAWYAVSLIGLMIALLLKPFVGFLAPVYICLIIVLQGKKALKNYLLYPYAILAVLPFLWWRRWIAHYPAGIPASDWLFNGEIGGGPIRFTPAWVRWLFYERLFKLILGYTGSLFFLANFLELKKKEVFIYASWWLGILAYFSVIATGNVRHDYYQVLCVPIVVMTFARGVVILEKFFSKKLSPPVAVGMTAMLVISSLSLSWWQIKEYYKMNHQEYLEAGKAVDTLTPANALVIAPAFGDTQFLYQTNRTGWPIGFEIENKRKLGATHYITTSYDDEARELEKQYFTIQKTPLYLLLDLTKPNN